MLYFYVMIFLQIVAESFPVSSSGHIALWQRLWLRWGESAASLSHENAASSMMYSGVWHEAFIHFLHGFTILALLVVVYKQIAISSWAACKRAITLPHIGMIFVADTITVTWYGVLKRVGLPPWSLAFGFACTAFLLYSLRWISSQQHVQLTWYTRGALLGVVQGVALLPGISRFGATLVAGCWLGFTPLHSFFVSWALQVPLLGAAWLRSVYVLLLYGMHGIMHDPLVIGLLVVATFSATCALWWVRSLTSANRLWIFSVYMVIPFLCALLW